MSVRKKENKTKINQINKKEKEKKNTTCRIKSVKSYLSSRELSASIKWTVNLHKVILIMNIMS